ncbi:hypothetical protein ACH5RR_000758, partial [Cinchona calisaya]
VILWNLWNNHNSTVFEGSFRDPLCFVSLSLNYSKDFLESSLLGPPQFSISTWKNPNLGFSKANFNATIFAILDISGIGIVVRDDTGKFIAGLTRKVDDVFAPNMAEVQVAKAAFELLLQLGLQMITIEGDAHKIINPILNPEVNQSDVNIPLNNVVGHLQYLSYWEV